MIGLITERELQFLLYELLNTQELSQRARYRAHDDDVVHATLAAARRLACDMFAPHYAKGDQNQPEFLNGTARVIAETGRAWSAFAEAGFLNAHWDESEGGTQLPEVVFRATTALFFGANVATMGYPFLTIGAANLLRTFGTPELKSRFLAAMGDGRCSGTMCLTEPGQGSALADITSYAVPQADGSYRLVGQKMFISGGDQDFTDNIVHMVLARIQGAPAGAGGISLFLVPKRRVDENGVPGEANDLALAGLLHKMGWRNTTSTVLSFGEQGGAHGYLVGTAGQGLAQMFHMMNEARIGVGLIAAALAYRGYSASLAYARERRQGRLPSSKQAGSPQVRLVEHADVRRLLLTQKAYAEGALALCLYASALFEDQHSHPDAQRRQQAACLLDVLTPVVKSWPARYGCVANDMAIQVLGGSGYTNEYPLEQLYRDQRLNPIHEGAEAIHGLDLLARKIRLQGGAGLAVFGAVVRETIAAASDEASLVEAGALLGNVLAELERVSAVLLQMQAQDIDLALANATVYLDVFGKVTVAWIWLQQALVATRALAQEPARDSDYYHGKLAAQRYFFDWDLRSAFQPLERLATLDRNAFDMQDGWFQ